MPVRLQGKVSAGRQYYLADTIFRPDSVLAYAPAGMLDTVSVVYTQWINVENVDDTLFQQVSLQKQKGVKLVPSSVE